MNQLNPGQNFAIVRKLEDPSDTNTYYVRGVIKDALTRDTLETVNLVDRGGQLFTYNWDVIQDSSPHGRQLFITTTVYTDSGYTAKSPNYAEKVEEYVVLQKWGFQFGAGGGTIVDYKKIKELIRDEISRIENPKQEAPDIAGAEKRIIRAVITAANEIRFPHQQQVDLEPISKQISLLKKHVEDTQKLDTRMLSDIVQNINAVLSLVEKASVRPEKNHDELKEEIVREVAAEVAEIKEVFNGELLKKENEEKQKEKEREIPRSRQRALRVLGLPPALLPNRRKTLIDRYAKVS